MFCLAAARVVAGAATAISADEIMRRALERAEQSARDAGRPRYCYSRLTVNEEVDDTGKVTQRQEKLYEVSVDSGASYLKLLRVNGRSLSPNQLKRQEEQERHNRQQFMTSRTPQGGDNRENFLTPEIVAKYKFQLIDFAAVNGRPAYAIAFQPKSSDLPVKQLVDRLLNHVSGMIWIDAQEFEIAKADVHLDAELSLWGGMIGSLKRFSFNLERSRLSDGSWFSSVSNGDFEGRKLWDSTHVKTRSESSNFRRVSPERRAG